MYSIHGMCVWKLAGLQGKHRQALAMRLSKDILYIWIERRPEWFVAP